MFSFIETKLFTRLLQDYLTDDPDAGDVIRGSGGVRKLRWRAPDRGKRGGYRVIYFLGREKGVFWLLTMYPKNVADDIPVNVLRKIRHEVENG